MTEDEKIWAVGAVRLIERLTLENAVLQIVLESHDVAPKLYERECNDLMLSRSVVTRVHAKFETLYDEIESILDLSKVLELIARNTAYLTKRNGISWAR